MTKRCLQTSLYSVVKYRCTTLPYKHHCTTLSTIFVECVEGQNGKTSLYNDICVPHRFYCCSLQSAKQLTSLAQRCLEHNVVQRCGLSNYLTTPTKERWDNVVYRHHCTALSNIGVQRCHIVIVVQRCTMCWPNVLKVEYIIGNTTSKLLYTFFIHWSFI